MEEVLSAIADLREKEKQRDPLEEYCEVVPDADECRVYDV